MSLSLRHAPSRAPFVFVASCCVLALCCTPAAAARNTEGTQEAIGGDIDAERQYALRLQRDLDRTATSARKAIAETHVPAVAASIVTLREALTLDDGFPATLQQAARTLVDGWDAERAAELPLGGDLDPETGDDAFADDDAEAATASTASGGGAAAEATAPAMANATCTQNDPSGACDGAATLTGAPSSSATSQAPGPSAQDRADAAMRLVSEDVERRVVTVTAQLRHRAAEALPGTIPTSMRAIAQAHIAACMAHIARAVFLAGRVAVAAAPDPTAAAAPAAGLKCGVYLPAQADSDLSTAAASIKRAEAAYESARTSMPLPQGVAAKLPRTHDIAAPAVRGIDALRAVLREFTELCTVTYRRGGTGGKTATEVHDAARALVRTLRDDVAMGFALALLRAAF